MTSAEKFTPRFTMTDDMFAGFGVAKFAYVKPLKPEQARGLFPSMPPVEPDLELWALVGADGSPIMLADSREAVLMNATEHELETMSVH